MTHSRPQERLVADATTEQYSDGKLELNVVWRGQIRADCDPVPAQVRAPLWVQAPLAAAKASTKNASTKIIKPQVEANPTPIPIPNLCSSVFICG